ncbi:DUF4259 domain-containing protein [Corynebacterium sp. USCH3]|uniref:DUF4259 domain-containing protein n=1 Tax=Corynebacterium sp. USCH3 TaxID=3024840 RepID=UPI003098755D
MSTWDETVFADDTNTDFLADCDDLEGDALASALQDACTLALDSGARGQGGAGTAGTAGTTVDPDYINGLCAATVAAIWSGAPFTSAAVADEHPFIREGIGQCPDALQEAALELLDGELEAAGDEAPDGLETAVEALS